MSRRRGNRKNSTLSIMIMIGLFLFILVGMAILLAPEKDPAPPVSNLAYEERPQNVNTDLLPLGPRVDFGSDAAPDAKTPAETTDAVAPEIVDVPENAFLITGTVVDKKSQAPLSKVRLVASRIPSAEEEADFKEWDERVRSTKQSDEYDAILDEKKRLWADAGGATNTRGRFSLVVAEEGEYKITAISDNHLRAEVAKNFVGATRPKWTVTIEMDSGAIISGRVIDGFDKKGVPGIYVNASLEGEHHTRQAKTDDEGYYEIGGLSTGPYGVAAAIEETAYRVTKELPYKRTKIADPDEIVKNIDFTLDKGGVVWGYIQTPDKKPIRADVVLCTSESILTQALTALVRQAPPLHANSNSEDGYYEMVGVPLNEQWRLYATADASAPQMADPFLLTDRQKEARVDIFMFTGSNVFGQVVDSKGKGVPDAKVMCLPGYGELFAPMDSPKAMRETESDEDGYFEIAELPVGNYQVMAHKEGYKYALRGEPLYSDGYHEIKNLRVVLNDIEAGNYDVFGVVRSSEGTKLAGAAVNLSGLGTESLQGVGRDTTTDSGGEFRFEGVEIGTYMLRATHDGYSPKTRARVLLDENNIIVMETSSIVRGQVLAQQTNTAPEYGFSITATLVESFGEPEERNLLSLITDAENQGKVTAFDDPTGNYEVTLSSGVWQLEASAAGLTPKRQRITLAPGEDKDKVDFLLSEEGGTISGRLYMTDGAGPQGATISLLEASNVSQALTDFAQSGGGDRSIQVDSDGSFEFDQLPEGTYYAFARHPAYPQAMSESLVLESQGNVDGVEIRMGPGGSMEGFVYQGGKPMSGWIVTLLANGTPYTGSTDESGAYDIQNIPAGKFQAFASSPSLAGTGQGEPVVIESGQTTYKNFGDTRGVTLLVTIEGSLASDLLPIDPATVGGRVSLNAATGIPIVGSGILAEHLPEESYTVVGSTVTIADVPVGLWRVDYYAVDSALSGTFAWRSYAEVEVTGESDEVEVFLSQY